MKIRTSIWLSDEEVELIEELKQMYKIKTNSDAIRRAIRIATKEKPKPVVQQPR